MAFIWALRMASYNYSYREFCPTCLFPSIRIFLANVENGLFMKLRVPLLSINDVPQEQSHLSQDRQFLSLPAAAHQQDRNPGRRIQ
jgi:hypothetical protein